MASATHSILFQRSGASAKALESCHLDGEMEAVKRTHPHTPLTGGLLPLHVVHRRQSMTERRTAGACPKNVKICSPREVFKSVKVPDPLGKLPPP